jgi:hypothetical protein
MHLAGGRNAHFDFPATANDDWSMWGPQLATMSGDIATTIK